MFNLECPPEYFPFFNFSNPMVVNIVQLLSKKVDFQLSHQFTIRPTLPFVLVSSLMRGPGGTMGSMTGQMSSLSTCGMDSKQHLQFPLSQRRKRRVLFTQAQVGGGEGGGGEEEEEEQKEQEQEQEQEAGSNNKRRKRRTNSIDFKKLI